jgi:hypothetical protein
MSTALSSRLDLADSDHRVLIPKPVALQKATGAWMGLTFGLSYVVLPALAGLTGLFSGLLEGWFAGGAAYGVTTGLMIVAIGKLKPAVRIPRAGVTVKDPFVVATLAGLGTWAVLHNVLGALAPFASLGLGELVTLVGINVLETTMLGLMLGSFTRSRWKAAGLAVAVQVLITALFVAFL